MSENRLLPVIIPQQYAISLTSPYGSPNRMAEVHALINKILYAGVLLMLPEETYLDGVTHDTILNDLFGADGKLDIYAVAQRAARKRKST